MSDTTEDFSDSEENILIQKLPPKIKGKRRRTAKESASEEARDDDAVPVEAEVKPAKKSTFVMTPARKKAWEKALAARKANVERRRREREQRENPDEPEQPCAPRHLADLVERLPHA